MKDFFQNFFLNKKLFYVFILIELLLLISIFNFENVSFVAFQQRDFLRALNLIKGEFIFFGPEMTGGGVLPGPMYYFLLAIPLFFYASWNSVYIFFIFLLASSIFIWGIFFRSIKYQAAIFFAAVLIFTSPIVRVNIYNFFNPSVLFIFYALFVLILSKFYSEEMGDKLIKYLKLILVLIGLSVQIHFTAVFFYMALILVFLDRKIKIDVSQFLILSFFAFLPFLPYLLWSLSFKIGFKFGQVPYYSDYLNIDKSIFTILKFPGFSFKSSESFFQKIISLIFLVVPYCFPFLLAFKYKKNILFRNDKWVRFFSILLLSNFPSFLYTIFSTQTLRYSILFGVSFSCFCSLLFSIIYKTLNNWFSKIAFILFFLFLSYIQVKSLIFDQNAAAPLLNSSDFKYIEQISLKQNFKELNHFLSRSYFINSHIEQDFRLFTGDFNFSPYQFIFNEDKNVNYDGFFIFKISEGSKVTNFSKWIQSQTVPIEIKNAIKNHDIYLLDPLLANADGLYIFPYKIFSKQKFLIRNLSNLNLGYNKVYNLELFHKLKSHEFSKLGPGHFIFQKKVCKTEDFYCNIGLELKLKKQGKLIVGTAVLFGGILSQTSPWISPGLTAFASNPQLKITCQQKTTDILLVQKIGFNQNAAKDKKVHLFLANNSFIAPLRLDFEVLCEKGLNQINFVINDLIFEKIDIQESSNPIEIQGFLTEKDL